MTLVHEDPTRTLDDLRRQQQQKIAAIAAAIGVEPVRLKVVDERPAAVPGKPGRPSVPRKRPRLAVRGRKRKETRRCHAVVCVETGDVYLSTRHAADATGQSDTKGIWQAVRNGCRSHGKHWRIATPGEAAKARASP